MRRSPNISNPKKNIPNTNWLNPFEHRKVRGNGSSWSLGILSIPSSEWKWLVALLEVRLAGQPSLFEDEATLSKAADAAMGHYRFLESKEQEQQTRKEYRELVTVDLQSVATAQSRFLGI